jgi:hypothetical protein
MTNRDLLRGAGAAAALAGLALAAAGSSAAPIESAASQKVTPQGVGKVKLGKTYKKLRAQGLVDEIARGCEPAGPGARFAQLEPPLRGGVDFSTTKPRRVTNIHVSGGATARGVGIGDKIAAIKKAYPKAKVDRSAEETFQVTLVKVPKSGGGRIQFAASIRTKTVELIGIPRIAFCD